MNEEIYVLLNNLNNADIGGFISKKEINLIIDKITNLQEENEVLEEKLQKNIQFDKCRFKELADLKEENERLKEEKIELSHHLSLYSCEETMLKQIEDYKSRNEKAIEYIEHNKFIKEQVLTIIKDYSLQDYQVRDLLNILQGSDKE